MTATHDHIPHNPSARAADENGDALLAGGSAVSDPIRIDHVRFRYPGARRDALEDVSLAVRQGAYLCVLGGNGSGKSTLVQLMNSLVAPTEGSVSVFGATTSTLEGALAARRRVAMVFQHPDDQMVTSIVADDVAFGPENLGVPQPEIVRRVDAALDAVGMHDLAQADPADLSGGQRQRVAIAGALAMQPDILLLDEPCAMLDVSGRQAIQAIIDRLRERGITIVHVTHFMDDALRADRAIVLERGRIVLDGTPEEVFAHRSTIRRLGLELPFTMELADRLHDVLPDLPTTASTDELACALAPRLSKTAPAPAPERARRASGTEPAITFSDVSFSYADDQRAHAKRRFGRRRHRERRAPLAVHNLTFSVATGSLTALVGTTGSGKSTTVELACALKMPREGHVTVAGIDTTDLARRRELRSRIGYVSQLPERQLFAETVFDDVAFGPKNLGLKPEEVDQRVTDALAAVGIADDELLGQSPFALSGGQQRAVAIAGILAMAPSILVLDEPMAGLDPEGRKRMRSLVSRLAHEGTTILLVTHAMEDVAELADHIVVLDHGSVVGEGEPGEVFRAPDCPAPGIPAALSFARRLKRLGATAVSEPITLTDLAEEVRHGVAR